MKLKGYKEKTFNHALSIVIFGSLVNIPITIFCSRKGRLGLGEAWRRVFFIRVISKTGC